jgi:hypothetical protein
MKFSIKGALVAVVALVPVLAFAQSSQPLTRSQVRAELVQLENAGYNPFADCPGPCSGSLERAEAVVAQQQASANSAYGPAANGTVQSGK